MSIDPNGHLKVAIPYDAEGFNEVWRNYTGAGGYFAANNIYSRLVVLDVFETGEIAPDLAETWDILDNGGRYVFHLNPRATWHDGTPVTAHDVVYTYREVIKHRYHGFSWIGDIETISATDDHTVDCVLQAPNAAFLAQLGSFVFSHIIAKHLYEGTDWAVNPHNFNPIGSGPFKFVEWVPGERIELVANHDYWNEGPYVERLTYYVMPDDADALAALERGDVHFAVKGIMCSDYDEWKQKPGCDVLYESGNSIAFLSPNWQQERFQDRRVREAIARLLDRKPIGDAICRFAGTPRHFYLEKVSWAFNPDATAPDYDPARAVVLLDEAGFTPDDHGVRLRARLFSRSLYAHYGIAAELMKAQFAEAGVELTTSSLNPVDWKNMVQDAGDFDLILDSGDIGPDPQLMWSFLVSGAPRNSMRYSNPVVDECFEKGRGAVDRAERGRYYKQLQQALADDVARVPFMQYGEFLPYRTEYIGWSWSDGVRGSVPFWYHGKVRKVS